jgi:hypothetical protein
MENAFSRVIEVDRHEERFATRQDHFRAIFDGLPAMVTLMTPAGDLLIEFPDAASKWYGSSPYQAILPFGLRTRSRTSS